VNGSSPPTARQRGRPSKFGRPSRVVAFTLPEDVIDRLHALHRDIGWAIVKLVDGQIARPSDRPESQPDVELVAVADRRSLIVVNREVIRNLPGVNIVPLSGTRAFLALDIDRGMSDLELAVQDRLAEASVGRRERLALQKLTAHLRTWRHDEELRVHTRAIILVEHGARRPSEGARTAAARQAAGDRRGARVAGGAARRRPNLSGDKST
jgi:hypothetical protein